MNPELSDVQVRFRKGKGTRDQIASIGWIIEKAREFQRNIYFCFIEYTKAFDSMCCKKQQKILQEMGTPYHLICLLRNLYACQGSMVRIGQGTKEWFKIGRGVCQGYILSPCLFTYIQNLCCTLYLFSQSCQFFMTPWTTAHQASLSIGFPRQEQRSGFPFPSPRDLPNPGTEPRFPSLQADSSPSEPRVHHAKYRVRRITSWNQDCQEKYL